MIGNKAVQLALLSNHAAASATLRVHAVETEPAPPLPVPATRRHRAQAWLALHCAAWPLTAARAAMTPQARAQAISRPFAVVGDDRQRRILACNEIARQRGLRTGHSLNAAIALCADVVFATRDVKREYELLELAALQCQQYTPLVSIQAPNELLLEVRGSLRLFGGMAALIERVRTDFSARQIAMNLALTPTPRSALWLARSNLNAPIVLPRELKHSLARLPVAILQWPQDIEVRLKRFGVSTLADLFRLPRSGLARRIGAQYLKELDEATGRHPQVRKPFKAPQCYEDRVVLDFEIETTTLLERIVQKRLEYLADFLQQRPAAITTVNLDLIHREKLITSCEVKLALPTADIAHVGHLIHEHLAALRLPAPVIEIHIHTPRLLPAPSRCDDLFRADTGSAMHDRAERLARLLEQLASRFGPEKITALHASADHRPECAQRAVPAGLKPPLPQTIPVALPQRPLWLLRAPRLICSNAHEAQRMVRVSGPERIETGWWDGAPIQREYYIVQSRHGARWWVFRDLTTSDHWYLQGMFG